MYTDQDLAAPCSPLTCMTDQNPSQKSLNQHLWPFAPLSAAVQPLSCLICSWHREQMGISGKQTLNLPCKYFWTHVTQWESINLSSVKIIKPCSALFMTRRRCFQPGGDVKTALWSTGVSLWRLLVVTWGPKTTCWTGKLSNSKRTRPVWLSFPASWLPWGIWEWCIHERRS